MPCCTYESHLCYLLNMGAAFLAVLIVGLGLIVALCAKLELPRTVWMAYIAALILAVGGCAGQLYWFGAETSGVPNWAGDANPYVFAALFGIGIILGVFNSFATLALWARRRQERARPEASRSEP